MKACIFTFLYFSLASSFAQTTLTGKVTDRNCRPVPYANVSLMGTYDGTTTDENGGFSFTTDEKASSEIVVGCVGFKEYRQVINLNGAPLYFRIQLAENIHSLETVTISAGSFTASDESRRTIFRAVDIATTAGATADIAGALNTLPGTQRVGESGRLFVRGGEGNEAKTFIDGLLVLDAYSPSAPNTPSRGRYLPFMFKGISFSTGGYSAEYGQALSSALVLDSRDKAEMTRTDIGLLSVGGDVGHTQVWDKGSLAGKIQYTNIGPYFRLIDQRIDWIIPPESIEGSAVFRQQSGRQGLIKFFGNFSRSAFSLYNHDIDNVADKLRYDLQNNYAYLNSVYKNILNKKWIVRGGMSYSKVRNDTRVAAEDVKESETGLHVKSVFEGSISEQLELKTGVEIIHRTFMRATDDAELLTFGETISAGFAEADFYASKSFITRAGFRVEHNQLSQAVGLDPRISLAYKISSSGQVSLAYGKFRQTPKNQWLSYRSGLGSEKANHYILNYQQAVDNRTFRVEAYYKHYGDLVKFRPEGLNIRNSGYGFARGIEVFWRDDQSIRNADYWISYSLLHTRRYYLDFPVEARPSFASTHNLSVVYKHFFQTLKSQFGFTYAYASGRFFNNPNDVKFNNSVTPAYHDVSFNWSYLPHPSVIIYFSCTNLLRRDNIFGYEFSDGPGKNGVYNSRPIRQPAKNFLFAGIFLTLSKEKSVNQLPNL